MERTHVSVAGRGRTLLGSAALVLLLPLAAGAAVDPSDGWRIQLDAARVGQVDRGRLVLGASSVSADGADDFDDPTPPAWPSRALAIFTAHETSEPGWETQALPSLHYRRQFDGPLGPISRVLHFTFETDQPGPVALTWLIAPDLDLAQHFVTLTDLESGATVDMWAAARYDFVASVGARALRIDLTPGRSAPPLAQAQTVTLDEDGQAAVTLVAVDPEGDVLTYAVAQPPQHGTLGGVAPLLTYVPDPDFNGLDVFTFVASDGQATSSPAPVTLVVASVNDAPLALAGSASTDEDTPGTVTLQASDVDGDALGYEIVTPPAHGALSGTPPTLTYTPDPDYFGPDAFAFRADDGQALSNTALVTLTVAPVNDPPLADFSVPGPARNVAAWQNNVASSFEGADIVAVSSDSGGSLGPQSAIDDNHNTRWASATGQATNQFFTVRLAGGLVHELRAFRLVNADNAGGQQVKRFEVRVSLTGIDDASMTTVVSDTLLDNPRVQEFTLPAPVSARYVQFRALDTHGAACCVSLRTFEALADARAGLPTEFAWPQNAAATTELSRVVSFSTQAGTGTRPDLMFDGSNATRWQTATGQVANQFVVVELGRAKLYPIDRIRLVNGGAGTNTLVKNFRVDVSATTADDAAFTTVFTGQAPNLTAQQEFVFPGGTASARYVRFVALDNWGSTCCLSVSELQVVPVPNVASVSSYGDGATRPEQLLDGNASTVWVSASGQVTNQFVELRLAPAVGADALVQSVRLQVAGVTAEAVKDFEIGLSTSSDDDAAFTTVLSATLLNNGQLQEFALPGGPARGPTCVSSRATTTARRTRCAWPLWRCSPPRAKATWSRCPRPLKTWPATVRRA